MSLYEIAILTRANQARTIGMVNRKGSLGIGADGDVTVYDLDPTKLNTNDPASIVRTLTRPEFTIKDGEIIARRGEIVAVPQGKRFYCQPHVDETLEKEMLADVKEWFKYYTIGFANYPVPDKYLINPVPIAVNQPIETMMKGAR
jgi:formylmethanofuran dehydrogenase subunit A